MAVANTTIGFIGAGRLAQTLAIGFSQADRPVVATASRSLSSAQALAAPVAGCVAYAEPQAVVEAADLVFIAVPDDAIASTCGSLTWRAGQFVVHCSGATELAALESARQQGAVIGGFHPLQSFVDPKIAVKLLPGSSVAIEAAPPLFEVLSAMASAIGCKVITLPAGARARYHAAATYSAGFVISLLQEAVDLWGSFGVNEAQTLDALFPLLQGTVDSARGKGLAGAIAGPISRGDVGVLVRHLKDLEKAGDAALELYCTLALRQLPLIRARAVVPAAVIDQMQALFERA